MTVSANTKNFVPPPRVALKLSRSSAHSWSSIDLKTLPADIPLARPVHGVRHGHVVGGDRLGHRAGGAADVEEPARHLLPRADLGKGAVAGGVDVDAQRLVMRAERIHSHEWKYASAAAPQWRCSCGKGVTGIIAEMRFPVVAPIVMAALCVFAGLSNLLIYIHRRGPAGQSTFPLMCILMAFYDVLCAGLYGSASIAEGVRWQWLQIIAIALCCAAMLNFVADYTGKSRGPRGFSLPPIFSWRRWSGCSGARHRPRCLEAE